MTRISEFLKVAEVGDAITFPNTDVCVCVSQGGGALTVSLILSQQQVGIDRGDIPDLSQVSG